MRGNSTVDRSFWAGKRVLLTGHTGFKGSWLALWLTQLGARVTGVSLAPDSTPNLYNELCVGDFVESHFVDICSYEALQEIVLRCEPEIVIHLAAQAIVRESYQHPLATFETNVMGTAHVLESLKTITSVKVALMVTTDKVYRNNEWVYPYRETDLLGGKDPYSASKAASEMVIASYRDSFLQGHGVAVASARAGNVIGGGDWAVDRLIPDAVRAWEKGQSLSIRNPNSTRPWQHVLDPLNGYLMLVQRLWSEPELAGAYNLGPSSNEAIAVQEVIELAREFYGAGFVVFGKAVDAPAEAGRLALDVSKAEQILSVRSRWDLRQTLDHTMTWYKQFGEGQKATDLCLRDISDYESA